MYTLTEESVKARLAVRGVRVPEGQVAVSAEAATEAASGYGGPVMVKALVPIKDRARRDLVRRAGDPAQAGEAASRMLGRSVDGHTVSEVLVERLADSGQEYYLAAAVDYVRGVPVLLHGAGGTGVEQRAARPRRLAFPCNGRADLDEIPAPLRPTAQALIDEFLALRALLIELNPVRVTDSGAVVLDGKATLDPAAELPAEARSLQPQQDAAAARLTALARSLPGGTDVRFGAMGGQVGLVSAGGGVLNVVQDALRRHGLSPANFADVSGGSHTARLLGAVADEVAALRPRAILIVTGITSSLPVTGFAEEMVRALARLPEPIPIVARMAGDGEERAAELMRAIPHCHTVGKDVTVDQAVDLVATRLKAVSGNGRAA